MLDLTECRGISVQSLQQCLTSLKSLRVLELNGDTEVRCAFISVCFLCIILLSALEHCCLILTHGA